MSTAYSRKFRDDVPQFLQYMADVWKYRHLCLNLVASDLRSRFRRSALGALWGVLQPLAMAAVLAWLFSFLFERPFSGFFVYVLSGFVVWDKVTTSVLVGMNCIQGGAGYLRQAAVPFFIFQLRVALNNLVFLGFGMVALFIAIVSTNQIPPLGLHSLQIFAFPVMLFFWMLPVVMIFSVIGVHFRDATYIVPIGLQIIFLTSPVFVPRELFERPQLRIVELGNPVMSAIDLFRAIVIDGRWWRIEEVGLFVVWTVIFWVIALIVVAIAGRRLVFKL